MKKKIFHSSVSTFDIDEVGFMEEIVVLFPWSFLIYLNKIRIFCLFSLLFFIVRGHLGSMHANREHGVMQNEYRYVQGCRELHDMCVYVRTCTLSFRVFAGQMCHFKWKPTNSNKNPSISTKPWISIKIPGIRNP